MIPGMQVQMNKQAIGQRIRIIQKLKSEDKDRMALVFSIY